MGGPSQRDGPPTFHEDLLEADVSASIATGAQPGSFTDPDDVNLPLDLKTLTHGDGGSTITYTAETYEASEDRQADFKWAVDSNNDQKVDMFASAEYEGNRLVGKVETTTEKDLGPATVERAGPAGIRVTFERGLLGGGSYQYRVISVTDQSRNEEDDPGVTDATPDTGFFAHALWPLTPPRRDLLSGSARFGRFARERSVQIGRSSTHSWQATPFVTSKPISDSSLGHEPREGQKDSSSCITALCTVRATPAPAG